MFSYKEMFGRLRDDLNDLKEVTANDYYLNKILDISIALYHFTDLVEKATPKCFEVYNDKKLCPTCGCILSGSETFCPKCSQAIEWNTENPQESWKTSMVMFAKLGYEYDGSNRVFLVYRQKEEGRTILFNLQKKTFEVNKGLYSTGVSIDELDAINQQIKELAW